VASNPLFEAVGCLDNVHCCPVGTIKPAQPNVNATRVGKLFPNATIQLAKYVAFASTNSFNSSGRSSSE
jgi:hypothetical protein